ncbi:MAG: hypothetical protein JNM90_03460 [Burkholderiales bacterium]|nr:hypothetical protein [Burkholderiales bacterium]
MSVQFELPASSAEAVPAFDSVAACADWLAALPLTNPATAQAQLRAQVALLPIAGFEARLVLDLAEALRASVLQVQAEVARRFAFRPLPLGELESAAASATLNLWHAYALVYQVCVQAALDGDRALRSHAALACQRALDAQVRLLFDTQCAGFEIAAADWTLLHKLYRAAEQLGTAAEKVKDPQLHGVAATHAMATYARALLLGLGLPPEMAPRQALAVAMWTERLANRVVITSLPPANPAKPAILVDLAAGRGGFRVDGAASPRGDLRYVDIGALANALKKRIHLLRKGETPASLGLGEDATMPGVEAALIALYRHWGDARVGREAARRAAGGRAQVAAGMAAMHYYISGKPFRPPGPPPELSTRQLREIATFGRVATRDDDEFSQLQGFALEQWALQDESVAGMRMVRAAAGARFAPTMLVAMKPADARAFMVGTVRWVQVQAGGELAAGVRLIPGVPAPVAARQTGLAAAAAKYQPALLLPAVAALHSPESLILPGGWFKAGRIVEVHADAAWNARLDTLVERGADFERCTFTRT